MNLLNGVRESAIRPQGARMSEKLAFTLVVAIDNETQSFDLGLREVQSLIDALPGNEPSFAGVFAAASSHPAAPVRISAARKECLPADSEMELASDPCASVRRGIVSNVFFQRFAMNPLVLRMIASDPEVAAAVAENFNALQIASLEVVGEALLNHRDTSVRLRLAECEEMECAPVILRDMDGSDELHIPDMKATIPACENRPGSVADSA